MSGHAAIQKCLMIFVLIQSVCSSAHSHPKVDQAVQSFFKKSGATSASIAIYAKNKWVVESAYGEAKPSSRYDMASLTKPLATTLATLWVIEQGLGSLQEPLSLTIPEFTQCQWTFDRFPVHAQKYKWISPPVVDPAICARKNEVTVEHLLRHRSGLRDAVPIEGVTVAAPETQTDPVDLFTRSPIVAPPGEKFHYADINFIVLQRWIELKLRQKQKTLQSLIKNTLFSALQLSETGFFSSVTSSAMIPFIPTRKLVKPGVVHDPFSRALGSLGDGHAGLFSSLKDLKKLALLWMNGGGGVLGPHSIALATESDPSHPENTRRGLGWDIDSIPYSTYVKGPISKGFGHTGFTGTSIWIEPESQLIVITLTNRTYLSSAPHTLTAVNELRSEMAKLGVSLSL